MVEMKTIKISEEAWAQLMELKIKLRSRSIDQVIKALLKERGVALI